MVGVVGTEDGRTTVSADGRGWCVPVSVLCTVLNSSTGTRASRLRKPSAKPHSLTSFFFLKKSDSELSSAVGKKGMDDIVCSCGLHCAARTAEAPATQRVVGGDRRARGWSFRSSALHQSCACTHRHRVWFLCCLSSQIACDFILRRHQYLCCSRGMVRVSMVGLRTFHFGTASEVSPEENPAHRYFLPHFHK